MPRKARRKPTTEQQRGAFRLLVHMLELTALQGCRCSEPIRPPAKWRLKCIACLANHALDKAVEAEIIGERQ